MTNLKNTRCNNATTEKWQKLTLSKQELQSIKGGIIIIEEVVIA